MRGERRWALCLVAGAVLAACGGSDDGADEIGFSTVEASAFSGITTATTVVVSSASDWEPLWASHARFRIPPPPVPVVDFSRHQLLALFLGGRPNGCYGVEIRRVLDDGQRRTVVYAESEPGPTMLCSAVATSPMQIVRVTASPLPVVFRRE